MADASLQDEYLPLSRLRPLLSRAEGESLGCAFAFAKGDKTQMLVMIDKRLTGKKVATAMRKGEPKDQIDEKSIRFGTVRIDQQNDPGHVQFTVHKSPMGGTIPLLVKLVKKAGYSAASINTNEALDDEPEEDGQASASAASGVPQPPPAPPPPPPPPPPASAKPAEAAADIPAPPPPPPPPMEGKAALAALVRRIAGVADPALKDKLTAVAKAANDKLAQGTPIAAELKAMEAALAGAAGPATNGGRAESARTDEPKVALAKSSMLWRSCRSQLHGKLDALKSAILTAYADEPAIQAAVKQNLGALDRVFENFDDRLDDALDNAVNAATTEARQRFVAQSRSVIDEYTARIASDPLIAQLDENPFGVDMKFRQTLEKVLPALTGLSAALH